jgi:hypothetical protein
MGNLAGGLSEFAKLKDVNLLSIAGGLAALGPAIVAFLGTQGIASLAESITDKVKGAWNYLFGSDEEGNKKKSKIEQIVDSLTPLKNLQDIDLTSLDKLSDAIAKFVAVANSLVDLPKISFDSTFKPTLDALLQTLPYLDVLAHGGEIITPYVPGSGRSGKPQNNKIVIKKGLLDKNLGLDEMMDAVSKIRAIVGDTSTLQTTTAVPNGQLNKTQQVNGAATDEQASPSSVVVQGGYQPKVAGRPEIIQSPPPKLTGAVSTAPVPSLLERHMYDRAYFGAGYP